ncbi:MAG: Gfo/Idh/MocA family oxidoreductase [Spirochaetaceae bacterium]
MNKIIKWGILGCGNIANKFAESTILLDSVKIVAAASNTPGKAETFANKHSIKSYYSNYQELLEDPEVDAVYVATTHNFHYKNVKQVLEYNKHVLCEKPMTVNGKEMKSLIELATEKQLFMMEAMWTRFLPAITQLREWLSTELIGEIKQIRATFGFHFPFDPTHRLYNLDLAGGALLDAGIYPLSFANMIMGDKPIEIKSIADIGSTGVDEQSTYIFKYQSGTLAFLNSTITGSVVSRAEIVGTKGRITIPQGFLAAKEIWLEINNQNTVKKNLNFDDETGFSFEIEAASNSIRKGLLENDIMPLSDTLQLMETIDIIKDQLGLVYANDRNS